MATLAFASRTWHEKRTYLCVNGGYLASRERGNDRADGEPAGKLRRHVTSRVALCNAPDLKTQRDDPDRSRK